MSWLARSIANSLLIDDEHQTPPTTTASPPPQPPSNPHIHQNNDDDNEEGENGDLRGVKEDITEFRETLTRQLWGVANFLAPPAPPPPPPARRITNERVVSELNRRESPDPSVSGGDDDGDEDDDSSSVYARISTAHSDNSDIGGSFQGGFINRRMFDNRGGVKESIYEGYGDRFGLRNVEDHDDDHEGEDEDDDWINDAVGLTDEVLTFAGNIGHHPETWLDFPVEDEEDLDDFPMSEAQKKHAQAVEHLTPRLAALRIELCPAHMSIGFFWKVYFVLLHSRLNKQDAELLSTPEVVEARAKWMQELQKRAKKESERYHGGLYSKQSADLDEDFTPRSLHNENAETLSSWTFASEPATSSTTADSDTEKQFVSNDMQFTNKSIVDEKPLTGTDDKNFHAAPMSKRLNLNFDDDDDDDWPEDDCLGQNATVYPAGIEEEVSFSDLEDDDCCIPVKSKP